jgi:NarL family two-component system response regulator LiaR
MAIEALGSDRRTGPLRVLIVDDHALLREGLRLILGPDAGFQVVGEARDGEEAIARAREADPDVVLMDVLLPGMTGVEATRVLRAELPEVRVVILTGVEDDAVARDAIEAGAVAYVLKEATGEEFRRSLRAAASGQVQLPPQVAARLLGRPHAPAAFDSLTAREREVLARIARGCSNKEIAREMGISHHTVKTYVRRVLDKLGVESRTQAAVRALTEGPIRR